MMIQGVFLVAAKRTPMGAFGGKFVKHTCVDLQEIAARAALAAGGVKPELIDSVIIGNVISVRFHVLASLFFLTWF